jgi:DNA polymerase-3 subunit delta
MAKGRCFLFLGPEIGERQDALQTLRESIGKTAGAAPEEHLFYAGEDSPGEMVSVLRNGSLFSDARLVVVKNADILKKKEDVELLATYAANPQDDTTLVILSDETSVDKRLEQAVPKDNKRIFWELFENKKTEWLQAFFRRQGFSISQDGIDAILELVENNTDALKRECTRLALFLDAKSPITEAEVERCLSHTREESAFTLFSRIAEGDLAKSTEILRTLLAAKESPQAIIAGLVWCYRKLLDYHNLLESAQVNDFELKKIGMGSKKAQRDYFKAAERYTHQQAREGLARLADFDIRLRSAGSAMEDILMDMLLYALIAQPITDRA